MGYYLIQLFIYGTPFILVVQTGKFKIYLFVLWLNLIIYTAIVNGITPGLLASIILGWVPAGIIAGLGLLLHKLLNKNKKNLEQMNPQDSLQSP